MDIITKQGIKEDSITPADVLVMQGAKASAWVELKTMYITRNVCYPAWHR